ncbi:MAG: SHOCT domain-containing protein [Kiritimatiellae bacterium]|nr:SHOCT domain-containing protein [Kiritimatiellia bacterium]
MDAKKRNGHCGKRIGILLILLVTVCCGCSSYRFQGTVHDPAFVTGARPQGKYRIAKFKMTVPKMSGSFRHVDDPFAAPDPWSIPQVSYKKKTELIICDLEQFIPSMFSSDNRAEPVEIQITSAGDEKSNMFSIIVPYLISLGIFPGWMGTSTRCDVIVTLARDRNLSRKFSIEYRSDMKLSFSPIGLIPYNPVPAPSFRTGVGIMAAPHINERSCRDSQDVFCETLAMGIAACLTDMERGRYQPPLISQPTVSTTTIPSAPQPAPAPAATPTATRQTAPVSSAAKLKQLRDAGTITQEEYETMLMRTIERKKE